MTLSLVTGLVLIALPIVFNLTFFALGRAFDYPNILRQPTDVILKRFADGGQRLIRLWYLFAITALLVQLVFADRFPQLAAASAILGVVSGLVQAMGLFRWPFLVPVLAAHYNAPSATPATRDAVVVTFAALHLYLGVVVGEHLGYLFTAAWTIVVSVMMTATPQFGPLLAGFGIVSAIGILAGLLEPAGWKPAGAVNAISYLLWSLWLLIAGVILVLA